MQYDPSAMQNHPSAHVGFTKIYVGNPPWDIGKPQPPFVAVADRVIGPVLDAGCGTGNTALFFAARGHRVTGIDFVEEAIRRARAKAAERGLTVEFLTKDAMTLGEWERSFASVIDSGLFHVYAGDDQRRYVQGLAHVLRPGGRLFLFTFTEEAPEGGVSRQQLHEIFEDRWEVESVELVRGEVSPAFTAEFPDAFPKGGPEGGSRSSAGRIESQATLHRGRRAGSVAGTSCASNAACPIQRSGRSHDGFRQTVALA